MVEGDKAHALGRDVTVAQWLKQQEHTVVPIWITAVQHARATAQQGPEVRQMESAQLMGFYDGVVVTMETGCIADLDASIQTLVANRLGQDYTLADFFHIANKLKTSIWDAAQASLSPDLALKMLTALEPVFAHSTARVAWLASRAAEAQLQEELEKTRQTLAKLDRTKSDFINIAAHELKTPLTLVQGYTAILSSELTNEHEYRNILRGLANGIERLQALIQDMIDVSLIDSDVLTLSLEPASLYDIVRLAVDDMQQEAANRHLTIRIRPFPPGVGTMFLDVRRMYQVFTNLVGNAIKYTPDNGVITVQARVLTDPQQRQQYVETSIADTGIGIAPDDLPHIFEKFYRVGETELHSTSKTQFKGGGPGLGLAITKGIVEAHGGRAWAESPGYDEQKCPGSNFHIMLPIYVELPERPSERLLGLEVE